MKEKDLYEELVRSFEFMVGRMPDRDNFKSALATIVTPQELRLHFLLPVVGTMNLDKFARRAKRAKIPPAWFEINLEKLICEGLVVTYEVPGEERVYQRGDVLTLTELQIRKPEDHPMRTAASNFMNGMIEGGSSEIPNKTPYFRVLAVEETLTGRAPTGEVVQVREPIPDPRAVLPIDVVSEMVSREKIIAVSECYCRKARQVVGNGCEHSLETCFYFNELALSQVENGQARRVSREEALAILRGCEEEGLVHNVDNCEGELRTLCNCCACSCVVMKSILRGNYNAGGPSRFEVALDGDACTACGICVESCPTGALSLNGKMRVALEKCIGCGLCASRCPEGALAMIRREKHPHIYPTNNKLWARIGREAFVGIARQRLFGKR